LLDESILNISLRVSMGSLDLQRDIDISTSPL
jgi:hypothetical protein